jgi:hypothetical protein
LKELTSTGHFSALDHLIKSTQSLQWHAALGADFGARNFPVTLPQGHFIVPPTMTLSSFEVDRMYPTTASRTAEPPTAIPTGDRRKDMICLLFDPVSVLSVNLTDMIFTDNLTKNISAMNSNFHYDDDHEEEQKDHGKKNSKSCPLWLLPQELFRFLSDYLLDNGKRKEVNFADDWRCFMNTNKANLAELKKQTQNISLTKNSNQFLVDPLFRQRILTLVDDPSLQISCAFHSLGAIGEHYDANPLSNMKQITVSSCNALSLSMITNVEIVRYTTNHFLRS